MSQWARQLLLGESLKDKLISTSNLEIDNNLIQLPESPGRNQQLQFSSKKMKFPKAVNLDQNEKKAMALHAFANHELLAIEMMAASLLIYPHTNKDEIKLKQGIISAIKDEQKHLTLYIQRLNQLGFDFGDFPLNDFFWKQMPSLKTMPNYLVVIALTFESANLDFSFFYENVFRQMGDIQTADIMKTVYQDEISHVALGGHYLNKWREDKSLWEYYRECLPFPVTPDRAKGIYFYKESRLSAGLSQEFCYELERFKSHFKVTQRKQWNSSASL